MKGLTELAELLLEKEVIFSEDLLRIFGKRKADQLKEIREAEEKANAPALPASAEDTKVEKKKKNTAKSKAENPEAAESNAVVTLKVKSPKKAEKKTKLKGKGV